MDRDYTLSELKEKIAHVLDELSFLDLIGVTIEDLVERFEDEILDNFDKLAAEVNYD